MYIKLTRDKTIVYFYNNKNYQQNFIILAKGSYFLWQNRPIPPSLLSLHRLVTYPSIRLNKLSVGNPLVCFITITILNNFIASNLENLMPWLNRPIPTSTFSIHRVVTYPSIRLNKLSMGNNIADLITVTIMNNLKHTLAT
jgi:hypothetical protein